MTVSPAAKTAVLFLVILGVIVASFAFAVWLHEDTGSRIQFRLTSHEEETLTATDLGGRHLMVFFGFTNCHMICPTQMNRLTQVMAELDRTGHGTRITPVFISVDPERDTPEKVAAYLEYFDERFVGLTGSRAALKGAADSFKTLFEEFSGDTTQTTRSTIRRSSTSSIRSAGSSTIYPGRPTISPWRQGFATLSRGPAGGGWLLFKVIRPGFILHRPSWAIMPFVCSQPSGALP